MSKDELMILKNDEGQCLKDNLEHCIYDRNQLLKENKELKEKLKGKGTEMWTISKGQCLKDNLEHCIYDRNQLLKENKELKEKLKCCKEVHYDLEK